MTHLLGVLGYTGTGLALAYWTAHAWMQLKALDPLAYKREEVERLYERIKNGRSFLVVFSTSPVMYGMSILVDTTKLGDLILWGLSGVACVLTMMVLTDRYLINRHLKPWIGDRFSQVQL